jgi:hypothetical protein
MNNTKTLAAIAAILIAGTLVVAGTLAATSATSAFAYQKKRGQDDRKNGNTVTAQICKQKGSVSGFDNTAEQECGNTICTHPSSNAVCVSEGNESVTPVTPPVNPPPSEKGCDAAPFVTLYNAILDETLIANHVVKGDEICLSGHDNNNPLGRQLAFDVTTNTGPFSVVVDQPGKADGDCSTSTVHITVNSGNPEQGNKPLTQACIKT